MGEKEQGGMLRTVIVIGLIAIIAGFLIFSGFELFKTRVQSAPDNISKTLGQTTDDKDNAVTDKDSKGTYQYNESNKTAVLINYVKPNANDSSTDITLPTYTMHNGQKYTVVGATNNSGSNIFKSENYAVKSVTIPDTYTSIGANAFNSIDTLTTVNFGSSIKTIEGQAFRNTPLSKIDLPDSVTSIGGQAFGSDNSSTKQPTEIKLSQNLTKIESGTFSYTDSSNTTLDELVIPDNVKSIDSFAFSGLKMKSIELGHVEKIGLFALNGYNGTSLTIPNTVNQFAGPISQNTNSIKTLTFEKGNDSNTLTFTAPLFLQKQPITNKIDFPTRVTLNDQTRNLISRWYDL